MPKWSLKGFWECSGEPFGGLGSRSNSGLHFPRKCVEILQFYTVWEPLGVQKTIKTIKTINRMKAKWYTTGSSDPRFLTHLRPG